MNEVNTIGSANEDAGTPQREPGEAVLSSDAGTDESIVERLYRNPESKEARLDRGLDESMDASDPPASTQPVHQHEPPASSGYDPEEEKRIAAKKKGGLAGLLARLRG